MYIMCDEIVKKPQINISQICIPTVYIKRERLPTLVCNQETPSPREYLLVRILLNTLHAINNCDPAVAQSVD